MVFGMNGETVTQTLRECRASIISSQSDGLGNVLTTMWRVRYNEREHQRHYVTPTETVVKCYRGSIFGPLKYKKRPLP